MLKTADGLLDFLKRDFKLGPGSADIQPHEATAILSKHIARIHTKARFLYKKRPQGLIIQSHLSAIQP